MYWTNVSAPSEPSSAELDSRPHSARGWSPWDTAARSKEDTEEPSHPLECRFFREGNCRFGEECHKLHIPKGGSPSDDPHFADKLSRSMTRSSLVSVSCVICSEEPVVKGRRFGLLEGCDHVFCLECIREWRKQRETQDRLNLRKCPICRVDSFLVLPSDSVLVGAEKDKAMDKYRGSLDGIPCKYESKGEQ